MFTEQYREVIGKFDAILPLIYKLSLQLCAGLQAVSSREGLNKKGWKGSEL